MPVQHVEEHLNCYNYSRSGGPVEVFEIQKGLSLSREITGTEIFAVISGKVNISTQKERNRTVESENLVLLTPGTVLSASVVEDAMIILFVINKPIQLCDMCSLEGLAEDVPLTHNNIPVLPFNGHLRDYFAFFTACLKEGLKCYYYLEVKTQELMFMLRAFYTRPELATFFKPLITNDTVFSEFILKNYRNVKTVDELARLSNYSRSGFKAHFRKTFGTSASNWMREKKARDVYHELNTTNKSLQQISEEYNFSSVSHMSIFCKEFFGMPPGRIRRENGKKDDDGALPMRRARRTPVTISDSADRGE